MFQRFARATVLAFASLAMGAVAQAQPPAMHLKITPTSAAVGKRTCFHLLTTDSNGNRLPRASVLFGTKTYLTGGAGRASGCMRLRWVGKHTAFAFKYGYRDAQRTVLAHRSGRLTATGSWHQFNTDIGGWGGHGSCALNSVYGEAHGSCSGPVFTGVSPFEGGRQAAFTWEKGSNLSVNLIDWYVPRGTTYYNQIGGWSPSGASGAYYVTWGRLPELSARPDLPIVGVVSGTDSAKEGQQGGPLHVNVTYHSRFLDNSGYNMTVNGYLFW